ncbi:hypothetical protein K0817_003670 [Microbacterium sp. HD4P20]|uniref:hypothetical protein n=1 Tax=Microbacterium sp. HD4P20 TaxID=2864874 RepID=UPI0020A59BAB|nr:hypothetical protein [Microbacterium sp. HD4P20]MCP2635662.1 hypothetical protein [Microbacterium sp. HD4P20]
MGIGIALGLLVGAGAGLIFFDDLAVGAGVGLSLGIALGAAFDARATASARTRQN